ncbi:MAG TPA: peptidylprolyl isomerase [Armatimonadota bacterium]|jgi:peptidyl-prolyl cis-trans isomerase B (cyclophilin B)|nr:peptidylprolyl isomerase [Armatimonadota bacterium]
MSNPIVVLDTTHGEVRIELDTEKAPISAQNFLDYVNAGHYNGVIFHRVISNFMVQGGGMTPDMREKKTGKPIKNEAGNGLKNDRGTVAMARTGVVDSATAQFFINVKDNDFLNHQDETARGFGYAVFGKVVSGMDVVDKIRNVQTGNKGPHSDVPLEPVVINSARVEQ